MKITKKKFVMGPDPNAGGSANVKKESNSGMNTNYLNPNAISAGRNHEPYAVGGSNSGMNSNQGLSRDMSKNSLMRDGSAQRLVEDKHLGPQIMKQKVKDGGGYPGGYDAYGNGNRQISANRTGSSMRAGST